MVTPEVFEGSLDSLPINIALLGDDGTVLHTNEAWQEFGKREGISIAPDTVGVSYLDVCDRAAEEGDEDARKAAEGVRRLLSDDAEVFSFEYPCHSPTVRRWFVMHANRFEDGGELYVNVAHIDVTRRKLSEMETESRNRSLSEFAHAVSHDLRNPLNVAMGNLEMAREDSDSDELRKVADSLERMNELIDGILERAESGTAVGETAAVAVGEAAREAWGNVSTADAELTVNCDGLVLDADEGQVLRLFENLFRNAVEHGGEDVSVAVGRLGGGFYVEDDGPGIPEDEIPEVFDRGMGLKTVREVAEAHGWTLAIEESADGGARFVFDTSPVATY